MPWLDALRQLFHRSPVPPPVFSAGFTPRGLDRADQLPDIQH
jgi:hypothetical protein